jgi:acetolactate synthase II small subunit
MHEFKTTTHEFNLLLTDAEGALVRVLGTIERRGFKLASISTRPSPRGIHLTLATKGMGRAPEILLRQIQRLHDVIEASFEIERPIFQLPVSAMPAPPVMPKPARSGMSFLGIPERISNM